MSINRDQAVNLMLEKHPDFKEIWDKYLEYWADEKPGITIDFSEYCDYVFKLIVNNKLEELSKATDLIELFIVEGDSDVSYGATLGFLEGITNRLLASKKEYSLTFASRLNPKSLEFCRDLDKFWGTSTPGA